MTTIYRDLSLLHPKFKRVAKALAEKVISDHKAGITKTRFEVFETYRDPVRQLDLLAKKATKAGPFESAHNFGLALDLVPVIGPDEALALADKVGERVLPGWNWHSDHDWDYLTKVAKRFGLVTISWDRPHVQHPEAGAIIQKIKNVAYMT